MTQAVIYSLKVWLTSVLLGPLCYYLVQTIMEPQYYHPFSYSVIYELIFSLPCLLVAVVAVAIVKLLHSTLIIKKLLLSVMGVVLSALPFYLIKGSWIQQATEYLIAYGSVVVAGIWFYKLEDNPTEIDTDN